MIRFERSTSRHVLAVASAVVLLLGGATADAKKTPKAKPDPALLCASAKDRAAAQYCTAVLAAWAKFEQSGDASKRDGAIAKAATKLDAGWTKADDKASAAGIDCAAAFAASSTVGAFIDSASGAIVDAVNDGLDLGTRDHAKCGQKILKAAAAKCGALLQAESVYQKQRTKTGAAARRDATGARVRAKFAKAFGKAAGGTCPTTATADGVETSIDDLAAHVARDILASPEAGNGTYVSISPGPTDYLGRTFTPICADGSPYRFFARRGTVNKLVVYYQGGGACWEQLTCSVPVCDTSVTDNDNPQLRTHGFAALANPDNPFKDWNWVFVAYCSCDIHFGDASQDYTNTDPAHPKHVEHRGYENSRVVEKWAREHFLAPEEIFVAGSSAGAYGAWFNAPLLHPVWPSAHFSVVADAGNGVVTQSFLQTYFPNWNFEANLPPDIPELKQVLDNGEGIVGYTEVITKHFPKTNWAHVTAAYDGGGGGQSDFYNIMLHNNDPIAALTWWEGSCAFHGVMRSQAVATAAAVDAADGNYRYFISTGTMHTQWGADKVYTDTTGGIPHLVDWVNAMIASQPGSPAPGWVNVEANPGNVLLPGDARPNPLVAPFEQSGSNVVVNCPPAP